MKNPTEEAYAELRSAYDFFNAELFAGRLPACLITYHRNRRTYGYFCGDRWDGSGDRLADEIALTPDVLSTPNQSAALYGAWDARRALDARARNGAFGAAPFWQGKPHRLPQQTVGRVDGPRWPGALAQRATWRQACRSANDPLHRRRRRV